jgi:hypothetical protein
MTRRAKGTLEAGAPGGGAPAERGLTPLAVNVRDASKIAGIGQSTIWALIKDGKLESRMVAGRRVIPYRALKALVIGGGK